MLRADLTAQLWPGPMSGVHTENREGLSLRAESGAPHTGEEVTFAEPRCAHLVKASRGSRAWNHRGMKIMVVFKSGMNLKREKGLWQEGG